MSDGYKADLKKAYDANAMDRETLALKEWKLAAREMFLDMLATEGKHSLLEIGAGPGRDSKFFLDHGLRVTATDLSAEMIRFCQAKGLEAHQMDFYHLTSLGRTFDAVWAMNCLLHVEKADLVSVLEEIHRVLVPGGLFFMAVYGGKDKEGIWEEDTYEPKRFFCFQTDEHLRDALEQVFDIVRFDRVVTGEEFDQQVVVMRKKVLS